MADVVVVEVTDRLRLQVWKIEIGNRVGSGMNLSNKRVRDFEELGDSPSFGAQTFVVSRTRHDVYLFPNNILIQRLRLGECHEGNAFQLTRKAHGITSGTYGTT
jgi:hypothetical protein